MTEVVKKDVDIRQFAVLFSNIDGAVLEAVDNKSKYLNYKNGVNLNCNSDEELELVILMILENNGFSIDKLGTYLYKDVIIRIIDCLKNVNTNEEILELKNELLMPYSQFYFDISRNEKDMGLKTFHGYIQDSFANIDGESISLFASNLSYGYHSNYGEVAFLIATTLMNYSLDKNIGVNRCKRLFKEYSLF